MNKIKTLMMYKDKNYLKIGIRRGNGITHWYKNPSKLIQDKINLLISDLSLSHFRLDPYYNGIELRFTWNG